MQKDLNTQLAMMQAALQSLLIEIGTAFLPVLTQAAKALMVFLQPVMAFVGAHPGVVAAAPGHHRSAGRALRCQPGAGARIRHPRPDRRAAAGHRGGGGRAVRGVDA